jgi:hypothetical protein
MAALQTGVILMQIRLFLLLIILVLSACTPSKTLPQHKASIGTFNSDTLGLALVIQFDLRNGPLEGLILIEVKGPAGWNNNQVLKLSEFTSSR